jgi:hypothetical protein
MDLRDNRKKFRPILFQLLLLFFVWNLIWYLCRAPGRITALPLALASAAVPLLISETALLLASAAVLLLI